MGVRKMRGTVYSKHIAFVSVRSEYKKYGDIISRSVRIFPGVSL